MLPFFILIFQSWLLPEHRGASSTAKHYYYPDKTVYPALVKSAVPSSGVVLSGPAGIKKQFMPQA
jgi:hypothetical protein